MPIGRISTYSIQQSTMNNFHTVQTNMADLQEQVSSGIKTRTFEGMTGEVERFTSIESEVKKLDTFHLNNTTNISRLKLMRESIAAAITIADDIEDFMTLRRNDALAGNINFEQTIKGKRETLANELNSSVEGRFLFSGTRTNTQPVKIPIPENIVEGVPDSNYYQGSTQNVVIRPQDNFAFEQKVRADDPAFQTMFAALDLSIKGNAEDNREKIDTSMDMVQESLKGLIELQTSLDARIVDLQVINDRHLNSRVYFQGLAEEIARTDVLAASTRIAQDETTLQATFQTFSRITSLSLVDFL